MNKLLITGASGFVGTALCRIAINRGFSVLGMQRQASSTASFESLVSDLSKTQSFAFLDRYSLDGIIHLAANSDVNACENFPKESYLLNVVASKNLATYAKKRNIPFVFASSDQVFDGEKGNYSTQDQALPLNQYGKQKLEAENACLASYTKSVVCRLPLMLGAHGGYEKNFIANLKEGKVQKLFTDEIRSVAQVDEIAKSLIEALSWGGGLYHLGGPKPMNRYEIGLYLAEKYHLASALLEPAKQADVSMAAARPKDVSMLSINP
ncbi:MAG: SDR family oxidoreductase [Chitinophagales bacterium]|nr:SDR family oxidoreductase [Chitinophagales bacterium]